MNETFEILLSSTLIAGFISALVTLINNKKNNNLKYITEERKAWRVEIRNIVDELENTNYYNRNKILQRLKVRINPYGKIDDMKSHDSHIWDVIGEIENASSDKEYKAKKEKLVIYLSFLLKYDWERAKKEVSGNWKVFGLFVTLLIGLLYLIYKNFIVCRFEYDEVFLSTVMVFLLLPVSLGTGGHKMLFKELWYEEKSIMKKIISRFFLLIGSGLFVCCVCVALPWYVFTSYQITVDSIAGEGYGDCSLVITIMMSLYYLTKSLATKSAKGQYIDAVNDYIKSTEPDSSSRN